MRQFRVELLNGSLQRIQILEDQFVRADFEALLVCEDDALWRWFMGREQPEDAQLPALTGQCLRMLSC